MAPFNGLPYTIGIAGGGWLFDNRGKGASAKAKLIGNEAEF